MKIIKFFARFVKNVAFSRTAQIFFFIQLILLIIGFGQGGHISPSSYHFEYEPTVLKFLTIINLPATFMALLLVLPLAYFLSYLGSDIGSSQFAMIFSVSLMYLGWQIQAALVGYGIEKWVQRQKKIFARNRDPFDWTK